MNSYALTTPSRVASFLDITLNSSQEDVMEMIIDAVTDSVENYCGKRFKQTQYTEIYDGKGTTTLVLKQKPVVEGETFLLERRDNILNENSWDTVDSEHYFVDYQTGIIQRVVGKFQETYKHYRVTYTAGYAFDVLAGTPIYLPAVSLADLELAVWKLCATYWHNRKSDPNVAREKLLHYDITFTKDVEMNKEVQAILDKYSSLAGSGGFVVAS